MFDVSFPAIQTILSKLLASAAVLGFVLTLHVAAQRVLLRQTVQSDFRRRWVLNLRNTLILLAFVGFGSIWVDELRSFAAALVAFAVAFVIATKEFILCINGSLLRTATNAYGIGDRIEIAGQRGDVIDFNLFTTTLLEVGPGSSYHLRTGRTIVVPNSKLLDNYIVNESSMKPYVLHVFSIPVARDWQRAEAVLLDAAKRETAPYLEDAREHMERVEAEHGLEGLPVQPRINLQIPEPGKLTLLVRVPAPIGRQGAVEQAIVRRFLEQFGSEAG